MTPVDPSLFVHRMVVTAGKDRVYDETFGPGVNVIRGTNSVGKSTIANMLFFGLGGEGARWTFEALACTSVFVEVSLSRSLVSLRRDISKDTRRPLSIFWGSLADGLKSATAWETFPFNHTDGKKGFSTVLFELLGFPEVKGQLASRLTMHQMLRLMYVDQITPVIEILRHDPFDREQTREAVGTFLCGIHDPDLYELQMRLSDSQARLVAIDEQLKLLVTVLADAGHVGTSAWVAQQLSAAQSAAEEAQRQVNIIVGTRWEDARDQKKRDAELKRLDSSIRSYETKRLDLEKQITSIELEGADSIAFIDAIQQRLQSLEESEIVAATLGPIPFSYCPSCYQKLKPLGPANACPVCREPVPSKDVSGQLARMRMELQNQLSESRKLQESRAIERAKLLAQLDPIVAALSQLREKYASARTAVDDKIEVELANAYSQVGYQARKVEDLQKQLATAKTVDKMTEQKAALAADVARLSTQVSQQEASREKRALEAASAIAELTIQLLKQDLPREEAFQNAHTVAFDFGKNWLAVNGKSVFSASSDVVLKNSFHIAILFASLVKGWFRYPRFLLIDNMEDKGMQEERSHNFQKALIKMSQQSDVQHQIIYTTSMPDKIVEDLGLGVGKFYTPENKTLRVASVSTASNEVGFTDRSDAALIDPPLPEDGS